MKYLYSTVLLKQYLQATLDKPTFFAFKHYLQEPLFKYLLWFCRLENVRYSKGRLFNANLLFHRAFVWAETIEGRTFWQEQADRYFSLLHNGWIR